MIARIGSRGDCTKYLIPLKKILFVLTIISDIKNNPLKKHPLQDPKWCLKLRTLFFLLRQRWSFYCKFNIAPQMIIGCIFRRWQHWETPWVNGGYEIIRHWIQNTSFSENKNIKENWRLKKTEESLHGNKRHVQYVHAKERSKQTLNSVGWKCSDRT